jgi:membrane protein
MLSVEQWYGVLLLFILIFLYFYDAYFRFLKRLKRFSRLFFKRNPCALAPFGLLILSVFLYKNTLEFSFLKFLLFLPKEITDTILSVITPFIYLLFGSFYIFNVILYRMKIIIKININKVISVPLLTKVITILSLSVFYPLSQAFINSSINSTVIELVGYSSSYFPSFERVIFVLIIITQIVFLLFIINLLSFYVLFVVFNSLKKDGFRLLNLLFLFFFTFQNLIFSGFMFDRLSSFFSNEDYINSILLETSYNEVPKRCVSILTKYVKQNNILLAFIDKDSVSIYIKDKKVYIEDICK